jgi:mono/diheme cytochrome c family protein
MNNPCDFGHEPVHASSTLSRAARVALWSAPVLAAAVLAACASQTRSSAPASSASVALTTVGTSAATPTTVAATATTAAPTTATSTTTAVATVSSALFGNEVMPVLQSNCASCHGANGPGAGHLLLATAADAQKNAQFINSAVADRYMPPWPADDGGVKFHDDRRLTDAQLAAIEQWSNEGGGIDVAPETPLTPTRQVVTPIERDAAMNAAPYKGSTAMADDYRCQIYDPKLTTTSYLQGYDIEADQTPVVHHALLFKATAATRAEAEASDKGDATVGWSCFGLPNFGGNDGDVVQIMSWGPGQAPTVLPADTGITMAPGDFFVMQIHYHYSSKTAALPADNSTLVADYASPDVIAAAGGKLDPINLTLYLGAAEIPCRSTQSGPLCDRDAAKVEIEKTYGPFGAALADALMYQCGAKPSDFAGMTNGKASSHVRPVGYFRSDRVGVGPHARNRRHVQDDIEPRYANRKGDPQHPQVGLRLAAQLLPHRSDCVEQQRRDSHRMFVGSFAGTVGQRSSLHHVVRRHQRRDVLLTNRDATCQAVMVAS